MPLKTKKLDQNAAKMFIWEFEKHEKLWKVIFSSYRNCNARNECFTVEKGDKMHLRFSLRFYSYASVMPDFN